jgi:hypothetical protein
LLGQNQLEVIKPTGEIEFYPLDPQQGMLHFGSDPRNTFVIQGGGVKPFHACLDCRQTPARFILLDGGEVLPEKSLPTLELGGYVFIVLQPVSPPAEIEPSTIVRSTECPQAPNFSPLLNSTADEPTPEPAPYPEVVLGNLSPRRQTLSWSKPSASYRLPVTNRGNLPATFRLEGDEPQRECRFEYQLPGQVAALTGMVEVSLLPGEEVAIPIQVTPLAKSLAGLAPQVHSFTITVTGLPGQRAPQAVLGQLVNKPLFGPGMVAMLALAVMVFSSLILGSLMEYSQTVTRIVLKAKPEKEISKPLSLIPFLRPKATPIPPANQKEPAMSYEEMFQEAASRHALDWHVLEAVAYHESHMNYLALGRANDMGLMQIIPSTWNQWAPKVGVYDPYDPYSNISVGAAYLAYVRDFCVQRGHTEPHWMLVAYNWGPKRVGELFERGGSWEEVPAPQRQYALSILEMAGNRAAGLATVEEFYSNLPAAP